MTFLHTRRNGTSRARLAWFKLVATRQLPVCCTLHPVLRFWHAPRPSKLTRVPREASKQILLHLRRRACVLEHQSTTHQRRGKRQNEKPGLLLVLLSLCSLSLYLMKYAALLTAATLLRPGGATPSATMRFMEHLHGSEAGSPTSSTPDGLYVSKRAWVEDRACTRLSRTPHLITTQRPPWFPSAVELAEGFYLPDVAAFAC